MRHRVIPTEWAQAIGTRIRKAREKKGWSQSELADLLVVHRNTVDNYEAGKGIPNRELQTIAKVLDVDFRWLLHGQEFQDPLLDVQAKVERVLAVLLERELEDATAEPALRQEPGTAEAAGDTPG